MRKAVSTPCQSQETGPKWAAPLEAKLREWLHAFQLSKNPGAAQRKGDIPGASTPEI